MYCSVLDGQQLRIIQQPQQGHKLEGITTIFNRNSQEVRVNPNSINVEIDNTGDSQNSLSDGRGLSDGRPQQMVGIQQADGQIVMVIPNGNSPMKNNLQTRLINISESSLMPLQESLLPGIDKISRFIELIRISSNESGVGDI